MRISAGTSASTPIVLMSGLDDPCKPIAALLYPKATSRLPKRLVGRLLQ